MNHNRTPGSAFWDCPSVHRCRTRDDIGRQMAVQALSRQQNIARSPASSQLAAFLNFILKMSAPELHEITSIAPKWTRFASFPGVVLLFYQNDLRTASTKTVPTNVRSHHPDLHPIFSIVPGASVGRLAAGERSVSTVKRLAERRKERSDRSQPPKGSAARLRRPQAGTNARGAKWSTGTRVRSRHGAHVGSGCFRSWQAAPSGLFVTARWMI